jgi:hypothetical protein
MKLTTIIKKTATCTIPLIALLMSAQPAAADATDSGPASFEDYIDDIVQTYSVPTNNHVTQNGIPNPGLYPVSSISISNLDFQQCDPYQQCQPGSFWTRDTFFSHQIAWSDYGHLTPGAAVISSDPMSWTANAFGAFGQCFLANAIIGRVLSVTAWVATSSVSYGYAGLWVRIDDTAGNPLFLDNMNGRGITGSNYYTQMGTSVRIPYKAARVCIGGLSTGMGTAYFDDFAVRWN